MASFHQFQVKFNELVEKHNRNNTYYFYSMRRNTTATPLTQNVPSPLVSGGNITEHTNGTDFISSIDPNDGKIEWNFSGPTGLYNCTFSFLCEREEPIDTELKLEFRQDSLQIPNWEVFIPAKNNNLSGNLFLPLTTGKKYSIWLVNEYKNETIIVHSCELVGRPMLQQDSLPFPSI